MANNIDHHFIPHDQPEVRGGAGGGGGGLPMPIGTNTGDMLVWNAATGVWEVLARPAGWAMLITGADGIPYWLNSPNWPGVLGYLAVDGDTGEIYWRT